ncbi:MAG: hypothetical protein BWY58_00537 [Chloroflexi bacterium ADurb.Bin344]|nr:MAG: hypothetical protein BWY58_00537 [Chloroflexi bacterium ADurb.Bin344]
MKIVHVDNNFCVQGFINNNGLFSANDQNSQFFRIVNKNLFTFRMAK